LEKPVRKQRFNIVSDELYSPMADAGLTFITGYHAGFQPADGLGRPPQAVVLNFLIGSNNSNFD
jgi:hypothetical protein